MTKALLTTFCILLLGFSITAQDPVLVNRNGIVNSGPVVTAAQINGLYKYRRNEFRILALGNQKLKVQFNGEWMTRGGYPNIGEAIGEATIQGNVATFVPADTRNCKIVMTFLTNRMEVVQENVAEADCGFGHNVIATGTYRRIKGGRPRFIPVQN